MTASVASWYVLGALTVFLVLEFLYTRWSGKKLPSWTTIPWIGAYAMTAGFWVAARDWAHVAIYLALAAWMAWDFFRRRKREKNEDASWKEMFR